MHTNCKFNDEVLILCILAQERDFFLKLGISHVGRIMILIKCFAFNLCNSRALRAPKNCFYELCVFHEIRTTPRYIQPSLTCKISNHNNSELAFS